MYVCLYVCMYVYMYVYDFMISPEYHTSLFICQLYRKSIFYFIFQFYNALKDANPNMSVYTKTNMPERFHFTNNRRIPPITLVGDVGYLVNYKEVWLWF